MEDLEQDLIAEIADCTWDPLRFSECAYTWGSGELEKYKGPYAWQAEVMRNIGAHLENPETRHTPYKLAIASGHGIGKSALISMLICWGLSTCEDTKVIVTANTGTQLSTKTVPECHKWLRLAVNADWWDRKATSVTIRDVNHSKTWRADFVAWSKENTEAFAGAHNSGKRIILIFDEASAIDRDIWKVAEGALTDTETEIIWLSFGNPTQNVGAFRDCFGSQKHRWNTKQIDSRTVEGTNKEQIQKWIDDWGEDSDFVRVRVRGEFPRSGSTQFISSDSVAAARKYKAPSIDGLPRILSVDVARFGDDKTVIGWRQGRKAVICDQLRGKDTVFTTERTIQFIKSENPNAVVIDGDGIGGGVVDQLRSRGYGANLFEFHGGATPQDEAMYFNKRAEAWGLLRDWLATGAELPDVPEVDEISFLEYGFSGKGQIQIEKKEDFKARCPEIGSPDVGDMLAMTFGVTIAPPAPRIAHRKPSGPWV